MQQILIKVEVERKNDNRNIDNTVQITSMHYI